ncbi:MAG TPA: hypothetical protein VGH33_27900 [Isosphaeraceae bacterium]|jgi:hypothetical protein
MIPAPPQPRPLPATAPSPTPPGDPRPEDWTNRKASEQAFRAATARHASGRRRFVDPTTCDRDYSGEELEFMGAMQEYKKSSGRMFPTWSEVLEVLRALGYMKSPTLDDEELLAAEPASA